VELRRTTKEPVADRRAAKQRETDLSIVPGFYAGLAAEAQPFLIVETGTAETVLGYALLLGREHEGHVHTTLIELGLGEGHRDRYEDVLDLIRDEAEPTAYLVRTDDCRLSATLLSRGLQAEASALVLVPEESTAGPSGGAGAAAAHAATPASVELELTPLRRTHVAAIAELLRKDEPEAEGPAGHHHHGPTAAETLEQVRGMAEVGEGWVLLADGGPQAVIARLEAEGGGYLLLDFVVAQGEEAWLAWGFARATEAVTDAGRRPAAVIDALDPVRRRILRAAGWYTAAAYVAFYDSAAGRPSVPSVTLQELQGMIRRKERFHLLDVMGEEHWKAGHLPGSEWIDFRGLGREARKRYEQDETIVVYCNGFT
jgi:hypothetical protein